MEIPPLGGEGDFLEYRPIGAKSDVRTKEPAISIMFEKSSTAPTRFFAAVCVSERLKSRPKAIRGLVYIHEGRQKVRPVDFTVDVWGRMNYVFVDVCLEFVRRIMRNVPPGDKRDMIGRLAWIPRSDWAPLFRRPDTFDVESPAGFWQAVAIPELERKTVSQTIACDVKKVVTKTSRGIPS